MAAVVGSEQMGMLRILGKDRIDLLHRLSTNDLRVLNRPQTSATTVFTTSQGKVVDWSWVFSLKDSLWVCTASGRAARLAQWIKKYTIMEDVQVQDLSNAWRRVIVHGDGATALLERPLPPQGQFIWISEQLWLRGLEAFGERAEGLVPADKCDTIVDGLVKNGAASVDAEELDVIRLEAGVPSADAEYREEVSPLEIRLKPMISWDKGCYVGQEVISRLDSYDKVARFMMGFEVEGEVPMGEPMKIRQQGKTSGRVTSLYRRRSGGALGLAIINRESALPGEAELWCGDEHTQIHLLNRPFWSEGG